MRNRFLARLSFQRRGWIIPLIVAISITIITVRGLHGSAMIGGGEYSLAFLSLLSFTLFLILVLGGLVIHNLARLWIDMRRNKAGAVLRGRMVTLFVLLSLLPTLVVAILSVELLNRGVDSWFSEQISQALSHSLDVAKAFYRENQRTIRHDAEAIVRNRAVTSALSLQGSEAASTVLEIERAARGLDEIAIIRGDGARIAQAGELPFDPIPDLAPLEENTSRALLVTNDAGNRSRAFVKLEEGLYLYTGRWIDRQVLGQMASIESAFVQYNQLRSAHGLLKVSHSVTLILISLLLLLAAVWSGFRIADSITSPITRLVIGTRKVADGDLSVTLPVRGIDELATLMASFNAMTAKLAENRTELQKSNSLLEERRRFMEAIVQNTSAGVISVNRFDQVTLVNPAASKLLGIDPDAAFGRSYPDVLPDPMLQILKSQLTGASDGERAPSAQIQVQGPEKALTLRTRSTPLKDPEGGSRGFTITFDDVSEILLAQRTSAWSDVARRIAHEIKNPLTPIQLWAQRMRRKYLRNLDDDRRDWKILDEGTTAIINQVEELRVLVNEFSNFARLPRPSLKIDDPAIALNEVLTLFDSESSDLEVITDIPDSLPSFAFDRAQVKQILTNLLRNAIASVRERMETETDPSGKVSLTVHTDESGHWLVIQVADNGIGIPPQDRDRVFEPYFTTKKKGTGLGLAIVRKIVEDHGGTIRMRESGQQGALAELQLPLGDAAV
ncbi:MAG: HAMP domain-containing protein [Magnetococcales bacterium]|nr:HAMP domain-containing protein [Magnetococcales bacterium]